MRGTDAPATPGCAARPAACRPTSWFLRDELGERVEPLLPEPAVALHPRNGVPERRGLDAAVVHPPLARAANETGPLQDLKVFRDGLKRHVERRRELGHGRSLRGGEELKDLAAGRVRE